MGCVIVVILKGIMCPRKENSQDKKLKMLETQETRTHNILNTGQSFSLSYPILFSLQIQFLRTPFMVVTLMKHPRVWKPKHQAERKDIISGLKVCLRENDGPLSQSDQSREKGHQQGSCPPGPCPHTSPSVPQLGEVVISVLTLHVRKLRHLELTQNV